jgi:DNA-binding CsgD family transcriptional regulator
MKVPLDTEDQSTTPRSRILDGHFFAMLAACFAIVGVLSAIDLVDDMKHGVGSFHAVAEGLTTLLGLAGATWMFRRFREATQDAARLAGRALSLEADLLAAHTALAATTAEAENWRREVGDLVAGLGAAIDRQLDRWGLSAAEHEVALLLLKGLSHKTIADIRGTEEATVRQQSRAIYRKAGLSGRHDLAAFFLEDLLAPRHESDEHPERLAAGSAA